MFLTLPNLVREHIARGEFEAIPKGNAGVATTTVPRPQGCLSGAQAMTPSHRCRQQAVISPPPHTHAETETIKDT